MDFRSCCRGSERLTRRGVLQIGGITALGLNLPGLLRAQGVSEGLTPTADACILIFLNGGPSHLDMWDMKPDAPAEIRGEFQPIATPMPGVTVSEHLPRFARVVHRGTLIRSAHHSVNNSHAAAVYCGLTGHDRGELGGGFKPTDNPAIGSVVGLCRPPKAPVVPYVSMPYITAEGAGGPPQPGFFGGWLGRTYDPLFVLKDPNAPDFTMSELSLPEGVDPRRLDGRRQLASRLDDLHRSDDRRLQDMDGFQAKAFDLLTSPASQKAFRIDQEDPRNRDAYGRNIYGQSVLAGASADRGRDPGRMHLVGTRRQRHVGHARTTTSPRSRTAFCRSSTPRFRASSTTWTREGCSIGRWSP